MWRKICSFLFIFLCAAIITACGNSVNETEVDTDSGNNSELTEEVEEEDPVENRIIYVTVGEATLTAKLEDNSSADALLEKLSEGDITIEMSDYASFEKVGSLGFDLPRNDRQYTTKAGDIILYQGDNLVFYYDSNSWNFTKLGEFQNVTQDELIEIFGDGNITATISITD